MVVVALAATATSLTGCTQPARTGSGAAPMPSAGTTTPTSVISDPPPSDSPSIKARTRVSATPTTPSARSTATTGDEVPCTQESLLPLMKQKFDDPATGLVIERVDIKRCRNHYAHVLAITAPDASGRQQYENEQLFLRYVKGRWESVIEGTGISCSDPDPRPEMLPACRALGYLVR